MSMIQLFYRGTDNSVYSRWRSTDGSWVEEQCLCGTLNGDPIAAQIPGTDLLQLFYRGMDNSVYSRWRNPDGSWSGEQHIGGTLNGDPIAAQIPGTDILQLFYRGTDNSVYSRWLKLKKIALYIIRVIFNYKQRKNIILLNKNIK